MAQDLSQIIQEGLAQTLTDLLGIDAKFLETTKLDQRDIQNTQLLQVNAEFEFDNLSTILKFMVPAPTASIIFNTMMGATDYDISDTIDDDTTDAMGEFVSNVSGSLVTAFNAKEVEELGKAKFHIQHKEILEANTVENIDTIYRFVIELDETPLTLFINFDENFLPFIETITATEPTPYSEEEVSNLEEESIEEVSEENSTLEEETPETETPDPESIITDEKKPEEVEEAEETEELEVDEKAKKMKLLIIIISSSIALLFIIFLTLYFTSSEEEEIENTDPNIQLMEKNDNKEQEELKVTPNKTLKKVNFNLKDIDIARLNGRLATLTKYEILTKEELETQKKEETKRLERLKKEEDLKAFAKLNKEEPVKIKQKEEPKKEEKKPIIKQQELVNKEQVPLKVPELPPVAQAVSIKVEEAKAPQLEIKKEPEIELEKVNEKQPQKLLFIISKNIKYRIFKSLVLEVNSKSARISMCNDTDGRTTILIGPFQNKEQQNKMDQLIKASNENIETSLQELSQEEFNQRCNF